MNGPAEQAGIPRATRWADALPIRPGARVESETRAQTAAIAAGDTAAFARFYDRWFDTVYAEAARATGRDEAFCLDVVQDAMMRVIRSMRPLPAEDDVRRWLRAVVHSCAYDRLRSETRRRRRETAAARTRPLTAPPPATAPTKGSAWSGSSGSWARSTIAVSRSCSCVIVSAGRCGRSAAP